MSSDFFGKRTENGMDIPSEKRTESDLPGVNERAVAALSSEEELEGFIKDSRHFILKQASAAAGRFITDSDDEWSVALMAFSEALNAYDLSKGNFYPFASVVIKRRVVDLLRRDQRRKNEIPADTGGTEFLDPSDDPSSSISSEVMKKEALLAEEKEAERVRSEEIKDEIQELSRLFSEYGFSFMDLTECSPKAGKTKDSTALAIRTLLSSPEMMGSLKEKKVLPMKELTEKSGVSRKIIDRHRRYVIACALILGGSYPLVAGYIDSMK